MTVRTAQVATWYTSLEEFDTLLDSMIDAQNRNGRITWTDIHATWAAGYVGEESSRIAVIDLEEADGAEIAKVTVWAVATGGVADFAELPE
jgi:hypothetical protein